MTRSDHAKNDLAPRRAPEDLHTRLDERLEEPESLLRLALDATPNCVFIKDLEGRYCLVNPAVGLLLRAPLDALIGKTDAELAAAGLLDPAAAEAFARADRMVIQSGAPATFVEPVRMPDGQTRWFKTFKLPLPDCCKTGGLLGVSVEVTELKTVEEALHRERDTARAYLELAGTAIVAVRADGTVALVNRATCELLGWPQDEIVGKDWFENFLPEDVREEVRAVFRKVLAGELEAAGRHENPVLTRAGTRRLVVWHNTVLRDPDGRITGTLSAGLDVTENRRLERRVRRSERRLRLLFENIRDVICHFDPSLRLLSVTPSVERLLGYRPEQLVGRRLTELGIIAPSSLPAVLADAQSALAGRKLKLAVYELRACDGSPRYVEVSAEPVIEGEECTGLIVVVRDVTERDEAVKALTESETRFRALVENLPAIAYTAALDPASTTLYISPRVEQILGFSPRECAANPNIWRERLHPDDRQRVLDELAACHRSGKPFASEYRMIARDGRVVWFRDEAVIVRDHQGRPAYLLGVMLDITRTRELEHQLAQAQKLEAIGRLAAGIAHEINTPTQYIGDNVRFIRDSFASLLCLFASCERLVEAADRGSPRGELLQELKQAIKEADLAYLREQVPAALDETLRGIEHIAKIVLSVKEFSHPIHKEKVETDVNRAIETTLTVSRNQWKYVADVVTDLDPNLPRIRAYPAELNQALLNLIVNAAHAIAQTTDRGRKGKGTITIATSTEADHIVVRIADTGAGIPEEIADKVFEPFFTTKKAGEGTGQGLAIARDAIVGKLGGTISFETKPGSGTTFIIRLPLHPPRTGEEGK